MPRLRELAAQPPPQSVDLTEPTDEELLAQLENDANNAHFQPDQATGPATATATATATDPAIAPAASDANTPARQKRKYIKNSGIYARPQEYDENGNPILPGMQYASLSLVGPHRKPPKESTPPLSLDPNGQPWKYPKKTRQGDGSNLQPFYNDIKQWIEQGHSSRMIAETLIARGVETSDRHVAKQRLKMGFRQRAKRKLTDEAIANMRKAKQSVAKRLPTKGDVSVRRVRIRDMRQAEITRMTKEGMSAEDIAENLTARGVNMRSGAPTVLRLQKQWGLIEGGTDVQSLRTNARHESVRRQKEQLTNLAQELGVTDVDDWVKKKMEEPQMVDARRRFAYELMGDAKPAIAQAGIDAAVARARRARDKRRFLQKLRRTEKAKAAVGNPTLQTLALTATQSSALPSQEGQSEADSDDENGEGEEEEDDDDDDEDDDDMDKDENGDEGEEEGTDATSSRAQESSTPMEAQQPASVPSQANDLMTQMSNDQHLPAQDVSQAGLEPPPSNATPNASQSPFVNIAPRPEALPPTALQPATFKRSYKKSKLQEPVPPVSPSQWTPAQCDPPPVSHLDPPPSESSHPSHYWQPSRGQADFMAQHYCVFPFHTPSPKQHTYTTPAGLVITMGFEYLRTPPTLDARMMMVPNAYIPPELQAHLPAPVQLNAWGKAPKYPPVVVPSVPVPVMAIPTDEAQRHKYDQKMLQKIQRLSQECIDMIDARSNNRMLPNSLTGLPPSKFDIQNAKKQLKEAAEALSAAN